MAYKFIIDPAANNDIVESIEWYNKVQPNLGIRFLSKYNPRLRVFIKTLLLLLFDTKQPAPFG